ASVAAADRWVAGNGTDVPSSVLLKSCAQTARVYAADVKARQIDKIAKRRVIPMSRLHACANGASLSSNSLWRKVARLSAGSAASVTSRPSPYTTTAA